MEPIDVVECEEMKSPLFWRRYWRRRPVVVRNGAPVFLGRTWSNSDFDEAAKELTCGARVAGVGWKHREGEVSFIERVSLLNEDLGQRMDTLAKQFGAPAAWCDTVRTHVSSGIGSHTDHSDNFALQQIGSKTWCLAHSSEIPRERYAARMHGFTDMGGEELPPEGVMSHDLQPGEMLYIPLMWIHSGVSAGPSLSLSVVFPAVSLLTATLQLLGQAARERLVGYQAMPTMVPWLSNDEYLRQSENVRSAIGAVVKWLGDDASADRVSELSEILLSHRPADEVSGGARPCGSE
jgi:50S ribosomal protein L16 3-hydroxylase